MMEYLTLCAGIIERGLILSIVVAAVYVASRLIQFDNLSIEGAFGLGGAVTALCMTHNVSPWFALCIGAIIGGCSGIATGLLYTQLQLNNLLSGIVVTTGLFSIILYVAGSNMPLGGKSTIFTHAFVPQIPFITFLILTIFCFLLFSLLAWFLTTEVGLVLGALGDAPQMLTNIGKSKHTYILIGVFLSNTLAALSGALFVQYTTYFSIWTGVGVLVIGVAGLILAEAFSTEFGIFLIIGSILYQALIAITFEIQLDPVWNKLITALLIVMLVTIKQYLQRE